MNPTQKSRKKNKIANHINDLKSQVLSRWRELVRRDREQWRLVHHLDDRELEDLWLLKTLFRYDAQVGVW